MISLCLSLFYALWWNFRELQVSHCQSLNIISLKAIYSEDPPTLLSFHFGESGTFSNFYVMLTSHIALYVKYTVCNALILQSLENVLNQPGLSDRLKNHWSFSSKPS